MWTIYTTAANVLIWLGLSRDNSGLAMAFIPPLCLQFSGVTDLRQVNDDNLSSFGLPQVEHPVSDALNRLLTGMVQPALGCSGSDLGE
jgi:hypothetical protein